MKHWKFLVPAAFAVVTMGAGCSSTGKVTSDTSVSPQEQVDASVNALVNVSASEDTTLAPEDTNATTANDTESLNNLGYAYDTNNF
ncbi:MAG: hypothetical protein WC813_03560 [Patescibacteria group bacterium]|jgi:outer membrane murein-binding lipoprotein Lpp